MRDSITSQWLLRVFVTGLVLSTGVTSAEPKVSSNSNVCNYKSNNWSLTRDVMKQIVSYKGLIKGKVSLGADIKSALLDSTQILIDHAEFQYEQEESGKPAPNDKICAATRFMFTVTSLKEEVTHSCKVNLKKGAIESITCELIAG